MTINATTGCAVRKVLFSLSAEKPGLYEDGSGELTIFCLNQIANTSGLILAEHLIKTLDAERIPYVKVRVLMSPDLPARLDYWIDVDTIDDGTIKGIFKVTGSTNLPAGTEIKYYSSRSYFCPGGGCPFIGPSGTASITGGRNGNNHFSIVMSGAAFEPDDEYAITIEVPDTVIEATQIFRTLPS